MDVEDISSDDVTSFNKIYALKDYQKKGYPLFSASNQGVELLLLSGKRMIWWQKPTRIWIGRLPAEN